MKDSSFKLIATMSKKIILQKKIIKYQAIIEDLDEYIENHMESTKQIKEFEHIFNKLKSDYKNKLIDTDDEEDEDEDEDNNDEDNEKMEIIKSKNDK